MDTLKETLRTLQPQEQAEFSTYLVRTGRGSTRKDVQLVETLLHIENKKGRDNASRLYSDLNMNAYHSLRKRLMKHLMNFILIKRLDGDTTRSASVMSYLSMSRFLLERNSPQLAQHHLQKAEQIAEKTGQWDLLDNVYNEQIRNADMLELNLAQCIRKWETNKLRAGARERLMIAHSTIRFHLSEARNSGSTLDPQEITRVALREFKLEREARNNVGFMHTVVSMVRSAVISTKDYHRFEPYVVRTFRNLEKANAFEKTETGLLLDFHYMIAHSKYRNRKFDEAIQFLSLMENILSKKKSQHFAFYFPKFILLKSAVLSYSGANPEAALLLEQTLNDKRLQLDAGARFNMQINWCVYLFNSGKFKLANKILHAFDHSDHWLEKKMGKEWRFKKNLIEIIVQYELGNTDIALTRIHQLEKYFSAFLKQPYYQRAKIFTGFIRSLINEPEIIHTKIFSQRVEQANIILPGDSEDIQAITFFCWLKSKMVRKNYYEVLMEVLSGMKPSALRSG
ncbi:MAG: hypothetical protein SH856_07120 [Flavobacteriales bacterium]|nr:hypothetical protein [Flavobacteriales bacterium]